MVLGLFSKERSLQRTIKKAMNKLAQSPDRWAALEKLRDDASEEALFTLFKRFSFTSTKEIEDQQEKEWAVETLIAKGPAALPALRRYAATPNPISYALRVLEHIVAGDEALVVIDEVLAREEPGYTRDPGKRIDVINWLAEYRAIDDAEVNRRVAPYLADYDENCRFAAAEAISLRPTSHSAAALVAALLRPEEESKRLKVRIADIICDAELDLCGRKDEVAALFDDLLTDFRLHRDKLVRKKT